MKNTKNEIKLQIYSKIDKDKNQDLFIMWSNSSNFIFNSSSIFNSLDFNNNLSENTISLHFSNSQ